MKPRPFPKLVDDPPNILFWSADEIAPLFAGVALGMVLDAMLPCFLIAFGYTRIMRRYRPAYAAAVVIEVDTGRVVGLAGISNRRPEYGHDVVADMLVYPAAIVLDDTVHYFKVAIKKRMRRFRAEFIR